MNLSPSIFLNLEYNFPILNAFHTHHLFLWPCACFIPNKIYFINGVFLYVCVPTCLLPNTWKASVPFCPQYVHTLFLTMALVTPSLRLRQEYSGLGVSGWSSLQFLVEQSTCWSSAKPSALHMQKQQRAPYIHLRSHNQRNSGLRIQGKVLSTNQNALITDVPAPPVISSGQTKTQGGGKRCYFFFVPRKETQWMQRVQLKTKTNEKLQYKVKHHYKFRPNFYLMKYYSMITYFSIIIEQLTKTLPVL